MRDLLVDRIQNLSLISMIRDRIQLLVELRHARRAAVTALVITRGVIASVPAATALTMKELIDRLLAGVSPTVVLLFLGFVILLVFVSVEAYVVFRCDLLVVWLRWTGSSGGGVKVPDCEGRSGASILQNFCQAYNHRSVFHHYPC